MALVARLLPLTDAGTSPKVLGLIDFSATADFERWKGSILNREDVQALAASIEAEEGPFDVPVGIAFKGEVVFELGHGAGGASVILVRSDGSVARTAPPSTSDSDLASWIHQLS